MLNINVKKSQIKDSDLMCKLALTKMTNIQNIDTLAKFAKNKILSIIVKNRFFYILVLCSCFCKIV